MSKSEAHQRSAFTLDDPALSSAADIDAAVGATLSSSKSPAGNPSKSTTEPVELTETLPSFIRLSASRSGGAAEIDEDAFLVQRVTSLSEGSMSDRERAFLTPSSALASALKSGKRKVLGRKRSDGSSPDDEQGQGQGRQAAASPLTSPTSSSAAASAPTATQQSRSPAADDDDDIPGEPASAPLDLSGGAHLSDEEKLRRWQKSRHEGDVDGVEEAGNGNREKRHGGTLRKRGIRERCLHFTVSEVCDFFNRF